MLRYLLLILILGKVHLPAPCQEPVKLLVIPLDSAARFFKAESRFSNRAALQQYLFSLPSGLLSKGYLAASVDSMVLDSPMATITLFLGPKYQWEHIRVPVEYQAIAEDLGMPGYSKGKRKGTGMEEDYREKLLDYLAERGYPFASVAYDSVQINHNMLSGIMKVDKGVYYRIDSISQQGPLRFNPHFINRYLGLSPGGAYQSSRLTKIGQRLDELPYAQQVQPWSLDMLGTGGVVNIYLEPKRSNVLNVLLGVMPSSAQTPGNKVQVTGDANILLRNSFRLGETIGVNWQQIQYKSPRLNLLYQQPYLFGSRAGVDFYFELFKKDTQFVNLQVRVGMPYEFSLNKAGKVLFHYQQTNVTTVDTAYVQQTGRLPDLAASAATSLGVDYAANTTNYRLNPRRGNEMNISFSGGTKSIKPANEILNLKDPVNPANNFSYLYDSIEQHTYQFKIKVLAARYLPAGNSGVIKMALQAGTYESGNYFRNELFQIGGYRLLRGFDEESIFARRYAVFTSEYRLLSGKNSYFFGFLDAGYAQYRDLEDQFSHGYLGTGLGMVLETRNSLVNISWAVGKRDDLSLDLRQSKIHLGLINFF